MNLKNNKTKVTKVISIRNMSRRRKIVLSSLLGASALLIALGSAGGFFIYKMTSMFDNLQSNFENTYYMANHSVDGDPFDPGFQADSNARSQNSMSNEIREFKNSENSNSKGKLDYSQTMEAMQNEMFRLFNPYVAKWAQIKNMLLQNKSALMKYDAGKILLGNDGSGNNSGFISDSSNITKLYINHMTDPKTNKPYTMVDSNFDNYETSLLDFFVGNAQKPADPSYTSILQKYFINQMDNELNIKNKNVVHNDETGMLSTNGNDKFNENLLITLLLNRITFSSASALFTGTITAPIHFFNDYKGYGIHRQISNLKRMAIAFPLYFSLGIEHLADVNVLTNIMDSLNYVMYSEASYIFINHYFKNVSQNIKIFDEAKNAFSEFYKQYVYFNEVAPIGKPQPVTLHSLQLYLKMGIVKKLHTDLYTKGGALTDVISKDSLMLNDNNIISPDTVYTSSHSVGKLLIEKSRTYDVQNFNNDPNVNNIIPYYVCLNGFFANPFTWV